MRERHTEASSRWTGSLSRRQYLATTGLAATLGLAGCGGGGSDGGSDGESGADGSDSAGDGDGSSGSAETDTETAGSGSGDAGGSGCPSPSSFTYTELTLSGGEGNEIASVDLPEQAEARTAMGLSVEIPVGGETASLSLNASQTGQSMSDIDDLGTDKESTDQYDFAVDGARSVTTAGDGEVPSSVSVYVPQDDGLLALVVRPRTPVPCPDTVNAVITQMVESFAPV